MLANNNLKVCRTLIRRDFRFHRIQNCILALAAALVTALYSFVFLLGNSVERYYLLQYQHQFGSISHILYTSLTVQQADAIAGNAKVRSSVRLSSLGQLADPMLGQRLVKLAVADRSYAETVLSVPDVGNLPENPGEIALDGLTMDSLGIPRELGTCVSLIWTASDGSTHTSDFTLCGWWTSPTIFTEAYAWISPDTARKLEPGCLDKNSPTVTLGVTLHQPKDLEGQAASILEEQDISEIRFTTNPAYSKEMRKLAVLQAVEYYSAVVLIPLCGYLMIYCIIHVAAQRDTSYYARLKSLGMTPRQIRHLLLEQGCVISFLGFLPGWALGFGLDFLISSKIFEGMDETTALHFLSWAPFAAAALCTLLTTLAAYLSLSIRLSRMMPIQVSGFTMSRLPRRRRRSNGHTTLVELALRTTLIRNRLHTILSALSLLLAVLLLSSTWIQYTSYREELYLSGMSPWDYSLLDGSAHLSAQRYNENNRSITAETVKELQARPEVTAVSSLKTHEIKMTASKELRQRIVDYYSHSYDETMTLLEASAVYPDWCAGLEHLEQTGEYIGLIVGLDGAFLQQVLENAFISGSYDNVAFASGDYVLTAGTYDNREIGTPAAGERVELNGHTYTIMGTITHGVSFMSGSNSPQAAFHIMYILPIEAFDALFPGQAYRQLAVDIDLAQQDAFEAYLEHYEQGLNRGVAIVRRSKFVSGFQASALSEVLPKLSIALVLLAIALINFANMLVVKTLSRRSEFAVYESLGMTTAQLRRLMLLEGLFHAALMSVPLVPTVIFFSSVVMPAVIEAMNSWCAVYHFSLLPLWVVVLLILLLSISVPQVTKIYLSCTANETLP